MYEKPLLQAHQRFRNRIEDYIVRYYDNADLQNIIDFTQSNVSYKIALIVHSSSTFIYPIYSLSVVVLVVLMIGKQIFISTAQVLLSRDAVFPFPVVYRYVLNLQNL